MKLPSSYDIIGDILIFEIREKLNTKQEKEIANRLLKLNKNIKVVAKRSDIHKGKYRTRKIKILAGENRKETIHKENGVKIKLDVEKCYFSPRLSQERLRIAKLIKKNESILCMFSGVAPYPLTIAKNSKAREIYGIEINPIAHKYALENARINRLANIHLFKGDVKKKLIYNENIGLKTCWIKEQLSSILKIKPSLIEFHLFDDDLIDNKIKIESIISKLRDKGIKIMIHCPQKYNGKYIGLSNRDSSYTIKVYKELYNLCKKYDNIIGFIAHIANKGEGNNKFMINNLQKIKDFYKYMYVENSTWELFNNPKDIINIIKKTRIKNLCIDLNHLFMSLKNTDRMVDFIEEAKTYCNLYFHISDSDGTHNPGPIGKGKIDFKKIAPLIDFGVYEIIENNYKQHPLQINCYKKNRKLFLKKFDRIIMPLPKDSEKYLKLALKYLKDRGTIHLYLFSNESDFNKIKNKYSKKFKVKLVRCGAYAPRVYRVCLDLKRNI